MTGIEVVECPARPVSCYWIFCTHSRDSRVLLTNQLIRLGDRFFYAHASTRKQSTIVGSDVDPSFAIDRSAETRKRVVKLAASKVAAASSSRKMVTRGLLRVMIYEKLSFSKLCSICCFYFILFYFLFLFYFILFVVFILFYSICCFYFILFRFYFYFILFYFLIKILDVSQACFHSIRVWLIFRYLD